MDPKLLDARIRQAAFDAVSQMAFSRGGNLESGDLRYGFVFDGERIPLINPQRGIFKPRQMGWLLSLGTVFPRSGARIWYDDQREAHQQIYCGR
jgi:putative restriction endonuclease